MSEANQRKAIDFKMFDPEAGREVSLSTITFDFATHRILLNGVVWTNKFRITPTELLVMLKEFADVYAIEAAINNPDDRPENDSSI